MGFLDLFCAASMPILKVLLITALGLFLPLDHVDIMGENAQKHLNKVVYFVFNPALVGSNLAKTTTFESIQKLWFMPINVVLTFIIGSALGWILVLITQPPPHMKGLVISSHAAGNSGNLPLITIPAVRKEKGSPFGDPDTSHQYGMAYASLSMALLGFVTGIVIPLQMLMIGSTAPHRVIQDSGFLLGDAAIPTVTLILGGNLLRGLQGDSGVKIALVFGIVGVRYVFLPFLGILVVKGAINVGMVHLDQLYQFVLLLQFGLPPAMNFGI